jgi:hypothetical protein
MMSAARNPKGKPHVLAFEATVRVWQERVLEARKPKRKPHALAFEATVRVRWRETRREGVRRR